MTKHHKLPYDIKTNSYNLAFQDDSRHEGKTGTDLYFTGLYLGHYLKSMINSEAILKALRSGDPVYFLARDMSIVWEFFKDMYPNAKIVYNVNRKFGNMLYEERQYTVTSQIDVNRKGIMIDSGFSGSMFSHVLSFVSEKRNKRGYYKPLSGILLSGGSHSSYHVLMIEGYLRKNNRSVVLDLEHSPKTEESESGNTWCSIGKRKNYLAFRLGFMAGIQGLGKTRLREVIKPQVPKLSRRKKEELRKSMLNRYYSQTEINRNIKRGLMEVDKWANVPLDEIFYRLDYYGNLEKVRLSRHTPIGSYFGYSVWKTYKTALKARELKIKMSKPSSFVAYENTVSIIMGNIDTLERLEKALAKRIEQFRKNPTAYVSTYLDV
jgi:hypothetical protein